LNHSASAPAKPAWGIPAPAIRLIGARLARSLAQGALVVDFALYAKHIGWNAGFLGLVLAGGMMFSAALTAIVGPLSDRLGRKGFVLSYEAISLIAGGIALVTKSTVPLVFAAIIGGFGRGANGAAGAFAPAEQSWISGFIETRRLSPVLSVNTALGFFGMGAGGLLAGIIGANRHLFILPVAGAVIAALLLLVTPDPPHKQQAAKTDAQSKREEQSTKDTERGLLWRLAGLNFLNGAGIGLVGPMMSWWFAAKFHASPSMIGPAMAGAFALGGVASLVSGKLTARLGTIRTVVLMRGIGLVSLFALPFMPSFTLAAIFYALRAAFNQGTVGARQAVALNLVRGHRRGLAATVNSLSVQVPRGVAPAIAGALFDSRAFAVPFLIAGVLQGIYLALYPRVFADHDPTRHDPTRKG
jgi:MFS family permease